MHRPVFLRALAGLTLATGLMAPAPQAHAVADCATDAMLVFDGSGSMNEFGYDPSERTRIEEAREAVSRAMPQIAPVRRIGLVIYGPGEASCDGIDLRFGPRVDAAGPVIDAVNALRPGGLTPLANSVQAAAEADAAVLRAARAMSVRMVSPGRPVYLYGSLSACPASHLVACIWLART